MNTYSFVCILCWAVLLGMAGCEEKNFTALHLDQVGQSEFHDQEVLPSNYHHLYGRWKLVSISGGFSGSGFTPDFDFLEIKGFGIYGLVRNDTLFEYGRIEVDTFDINRAEVLQIRLVPQVYSGSNPHINPGEKYVEFRGSDILDLSSPCCDMYNYHFKKMGE
jgi:hypothetical protein